MEKSPEYGNKSLKVRILNYLLNSKF